MVNSESSSTDHEIIIRNLQPEDIDEVMEVAALAFGDPQMAHKRKHYESHLKHFPEGQLCAVYKGKIVGSSASLIVNFDEDYGEQHTLGEISGGGFITNHNPNGVNLYGIDIAVHPAYRQLKIGRRLYEARKKVCKRLNLKSIIFGGRIPNYHKYADKYSPEEYVKQVEMQNIYDPVLTFQLRNGFEIRGVIKDYWKLDDESLGYATLLEWKNEDYVPPTRQLYQYRDPVKVATVQYLLRGIESFGDFADQVEFYVSNCSRQRADFILFPEAITSHLVSYMGEKIPSQQVRNLTKFTDDYLNLFSELAIRYSINIVAGSHYLEEDGAIYNVSHLFHRNGKIDKQYKLHISREEKLYHGTSPGAGLNVIDTDCGKVAVIIGTDIAFSEIAKRAVEQGVEILFVPFNTENSKDYLRIRYCAQARAVEYQVYVAMSGMVGNLPHVRRMKGHYAKSGIFSPVDFDFTSEGIVVESDANVEDVSVGELDLEKIRRKHLRKSQAQMKQPDLQLMKAVK